MFRATGTERRRLALRTTCDFGLRRHRPRLETSAFVPWRKPRAARIGGAALPLRSRTTLSGAPSWTLALASRRYEAVTAGRAPRQGREGQQEEDGHGRRRPHPGARGPHPAAGAGQPLLRQPTGPPQHAKAPLRRHRPRRFRDAPRQDVHGRRRRYPGALRACPGSSIVKNQGPSAPLRSARSPRRSARGRHESRGIEHPQKALWAYQRGQFGRARWLSSTTVLRSVPSSRCQSSHTSHCGNHGATPRPARRSLTP
jgi:hypothetical protein